MSDPQLAPWPQQPRTAPVSADLVRVSDADRDAVARLLAEAYADGRLTRSEHDDRLSRTLASRTVGDLAALTVDLRGVASASDGTQAWLFGAPRPADGSGTVVSVFGGSSRKGHWFVPRLINTITVFGGTDLDLRAATFTSPEVDVTIACLFGGVNLVVPEGVRVESQVVSIFGGCDTGQATPAPGAPTVRLRGICLFGGVSVKSKRRKTPPPATAPDRELR